MTSPAGQSPSANGDCVFCAIVAGRSPAAVVHRDERVLAFLDIAPVTTPGHLLVIPRDHHEGLQELPADLGAGMFRVAHRLSSSLRRSGVRCAGVDLFLADGAEAGQEVFHVHLHVFPRYRNDGFVLDAEPKTVEAPELNRIAALLRAVE